VQGAFCASETLGGQRRHIQPFRRLRFPKIHFVILSEAKELIFTASVAFRNSYDTHLAGIFVKRFFKVALFLRMIYSIIKGL